MWKAPAATSSPTRAGCRCPLIAVVLSRGFVTGTLMFTDTIDRTFDRLFATTASGRRGAAPTGHGRSAARRAGADRPGVHGRQRQARAGVRPSTATSPPSAVRRRRGQGQANSNSSGAPDPGPNWYADRSRRSNLTSGHAAGRAPARSSSTPTPRTRSTSRSARARVVIGRAGDLPGDHQRDRDLPDHQPRRGDRSTSTPPPRRPSCSARPDVFTGVGPGRHARHRRRPAQGRDVRQASAAATT